MPKTNIGRDFLFSDDCGFIKGDENGTSHKYADGSGYYHGDDGSEGHIYNDGSGYYHGADGSEGYLYSDGSAYFHGSDGTDAYKYDDGSGYYHGADGSDGYRYSDGSGYFTDSNGNRASYDSQNDGYLEESESSYVPDNDENADEERMSYVSNNNEDSDVSLLGLIALCGALGLASKRSARKREEKGRRRLEEERLERERRALQQERESKQNKQNKRRKAFLFNKKKILLEYSYSDFIGEDIDFVTEKLKDNGFSNILIAPLKDLYVGSNKSVGEVEEVYINGKSQFSNGELVKYDEEILVTFHTKKEFKFPYSIREMINQNYKKIAQELMEIGFTEVYIAPLEDLMTGWIKKDGTVMNVIIEGINSIKEGMYIEYDREIVIQYHSFKM